MTMDIIALRGHGSTPGNWQWNKQHPYQLVVNCFCDYCVNNRSIVIGCACEFCSISQIYNNKNDNEPITSRTSTDCDSEEGITVGLIDSIISISKVLGRRLDANLLSMAVCEALEDLMICEDLKKVMNTLEPTPNTGAKER